MVERVARAICKIAQPPPGQPCHDCWDDERGCSQWQEYVEEARAAIEAVRVTTDEMVRAGISRLDLSVDDVWRDMNADL
jgi:hypothetical protein